MTKLTPPIFDKHEHAVRVCPERDARCPHGMNCPFAVSRYQCDIAASRTALSTKQGETKP